MTTQPSSRHSIDQSHLFYGIALSMVSGVGPLMAKTLVGYCGGFKEVFNTKKSTLLKIPGVGNVTVEAIHNFNEYMRVEQEMKVIEHHDIHPLFFTDKSYPQRLLNNNDSPILLYTRGNLKLNTDRTLGIVGTRSPSLQAVQWTNELVAALKDHDVSIISGFAYGIDIAAHKACIKNQVPTIGVMAGGFGTIYPAAHKRYMAAIEANGGFITESAFSILPDKMRFPMRNRIIAGLSDGLIVVESAIKGGSMITADYAFNYDKCLMAVPGKPSDPLSSGCNKLIKDQKAALIEDIQDVVHLLNYDVGGAENFVQPTLFRQLTPQEEMLIGILKVRREINVDTIIKEIRIKNSELAAMILSLTMDGLITQLPGNRIALR